MEKENNPYLSSAEQTKTNNLKQKLLRGVSALALAGFITLSGTGCSTLVTPEAIQSIQLQISETTDIRTDGEVLNTLMKQVTKASAQERKMLSDAFKILLKIESGNALLRRVPSDMKFKVKDFDTESDGGYDSWQGDIVLNKNKFNEKEKDWIPVTLAHELGHMMQYEMKLSGLTKDKTSLSPFQVASLDKLNEAEMMAFTFDTIYQIRDKVSPVFYERMLRENGIYSYPLFSEYAALYEKNEKMFKEAGLPERDVEKNARRETMGTFVMAVLDESVMEKLPLRQDVRFGAVQRASAWNKIYDAQALGNLAKLVSWRSGSLSAEGNDELYRYMLGEHVEGLGLSAQELEDALDSNLKLQKETYLSAAVLANYEEGVSKADAFLLKKEIAKTPEYLKVTENYRSGSSDFSESVKNFPIIESLVKSR